MYVQGQEHVSETPCKIRKNNEDLELTRNGASENLQKGALVQSKFPCNSLLSCRTSLTTAGLSGLLSIGVRFDPGFVSCLKS